MKFTITPRARLGFTPTYDGMLVGPKGDSAYMVAVGNGFDGTEQQWLDSIKGADGADGATGATGATGSQGKSAYQVAVDNGYTGTEQQWLASLKGDGIVFVNNDTERDASMTGTSQKLIIVKSSAYNSNQQTSYTYDGNGGLFWIAAVRIN